MALISNFSRLVNGVQRNVDISANTLVVDTLRVGGGSGTDLTKTIMDRLVTLQSGAEVGSAYHIHDTIYYRQSQLNSTSTGASGAKLIGVDGTPTNYTAATQDVKAHLVGIDAALAAATASVAYDNVFRIQNGADHTKQLAFSVSAVTAGQTRTVTMADANVNLADVNNSILRDGSRSFTANQPMGTNKLTGLAAGSTAGDSVRYEQAILASGVNPWTGNQALGGFKITGSADPTSAQDVATKAYVDQVALGLSPKKAVRVATTANITLSGAQTIDGIAAVAGDRVLVKDQSTASANGIYVVAAGAWSRSTDMDNLTPIDEFNGAWVPVQLGTVNAGRIYVEYSVVTTIGTDPINFEFYNPLASLIGGDMIAVSGSTISVDLAANSGLASTNPGNAAGQLTIVLEGANPSLQVSGSNELGVKLDAARAITKNASGLGVNVDNSTVEISTNAVRVKDAGITAAKLNTNVADQVTIVGGAGTPLSIASTPNVKKTLVAGEAFAANSTFVVRWAINGETAGRVYKADKDASVTSKYMAIGLALSTTAVIAGGNIDVVTLGDFILGSGDSAFSSANVGLELFVGTGGGLVFGAALAGTTGEAAFCIGTVETTTKIWVDQKTLRGIA